MKKILTNGISGKINPPSKLLLSIEQRKKFDELLKKEAEKK